MKFVGYFHSCPRPYPFPSCHCGHNQTVTVTDGPSGRTYSQTLMPCDECEPGEAPKVPEPSYDPETGVIRVSGTPMVAPRPRRS